jgi:5-methylcytosine-specific restriction endonuclease McrA
LWRFLNDEFSLEEGARDLLIDGQSYPLAEKTCSLLDDDVKTKHLFAYPLTIVIISKASEDEVADLFYRLNNGTPLTAAEVRNSMPGKVTKFVRELAAHPFFKKCAFKNSRKAYDQVAAQMLCLEINRGLTEISDKILTPMYREWESGLPLKVTKAVGKNLDLLDRIFPDKSRLLKRATAINLYWLISYLSKHHNITKAAKDIHEWFEKTEPKRLKDPQYSFLMTRAANSRASAEGRFRWVLTEFMADFEKFQIVELDSQRHFNDLQKAEIFACAGGRCQGTFCGGKVVKGDKWHADHIVPWIQGGRTEVSNGQVLCPICNLKKGTRLW